MAKFIVNDSFQFGGLVRRQGVTLAISDAEVAAELAKGVHPKTKKSLSGLLNHCSPADEATAKLIDKPAPEEDEGEEEGGGELAELRAEFDRIGAGYDLRWGLGRTRNELVKAKKERGEE